MEKQFIENWQESSRSLAGLFKDIGDKNISLTRELVCNIASKQWDKMTLAALQLSQGIGDTGRKEFIDVSANSFLMPIPSDRDIESFKELSEIYQAAFERLCESQFAVSKSYLDLVSDYTDNLKKSRDINDVVATNFDYLSNLMMAAKSGALDSLQIGESIKTALVAWSENRTIF